MRKLLQRAVFLVAFAVYSLHGADSLVWHTNDVDAEIGNWPLPRVLEEISNVTGWEVYVEPGTTHNVSVKFKNAPETDALKRLLGNLSFTLMPQTNTVRKLYVFQTTMGQATQLIRPTAPVLGTGRDGRIPNELVVTLHEGCGSIDDLAKKLNAKVLGRFEQFHVYRLQFGSEQLANKARADLNADQCVASIESNYAVPAPPTPQAKPLAATSMLPFDLKANPDPNHVIIALIDSHVQKLDPAMQQFVLEAIAESGEWSGNPNDPTHGTFMLESILHAVQQLEGAGTKSSVRILPIDVYGNNSSSTMFDIAHGMADAAKGGARIINLSLGSYGDSPLVQEVIARLSAQGIVFIAAAGNQPVTAPTFPAAYNGVLAVTAADATGNVAPYANRGAFVDVIFPGSDIGTIGTTAYQVNGTSTSTALASGTAAALMEKKALSPSGTISYMTSKFAFQPK